MPPMPHVICKNVLFSLPNDSTNGIPITPQQPENMFVFKEKHSIITTNALTKSLWAVDDPETNQSYGVIFPSVPDLSEEKFELTITGHVFSKNDDPSTSNMVALLYVIGKNKKCECVMFKMWSKS